MINAKGEFNQHVAGMKVKCADIYMSDWSGRPTGLVAQLRVGHTLSEYAAFTKKLDFNYDNGFGGQVLFGTIWYEDGTWSERGEYDGSEWWEHHVCPAIPDELK